MKLKARLLLVNKRVGLKSFLAVHFLLSYKFQEFELTLNFFGQEQLCYAEVWGCHCSCGVFMCQNESRVLKSLFSQACRLTSSKEHTKFSHLESNG